MAVGQALLAAGGDPPGSCIDKLEYHLLLAQDFESDSVKGLSALGEQIVEIKRMLSEFAQKLTADS